MNHHDIGNDTYFQKTYAGWLGKIIGIRLGSPIEGWSYERIQKTYGSIETYLTDYHDYAADDDSNGPLFFIRALIDHRDPEEQISAEEMGETWLNYVPQEHGFFWWGGYGVSTEHTAYENLKAGIPAPRSGSAAQNGKTCSEQIGGQIFSDPWGFVYPGDPHKAAAYAGKMSSVSHDGEGIYGGMFIAACVSAAYIEHSIRGIIDAGLHVIPADSAYAAVVRDVIAFFEADDSHDWRTCFQFVHTHYGYENYGGHCHIIPNTAVIILSLLYGNGDFSRTQQICNMCGWDTDCNAGNVGAILGVYVGPEQIEQHWITPINDLLIASSVIGGLNLTTVARSAELFCTLGCSQAQTPLPAPWKERQIPDTQIFHFDFIASTQSLRLSSTGAVRDLRMENTARSAKQGHRALRIEGSMAAGSSVQAMMKTYYTPEDLEDSRYDPSFTPVIFPGQCLSASLRSDEGQQLLVRLFARDLRHGYEHTTEWTLVQGIWKGLELPIPGTSGGLIASVGIEYRRVDTTDAAAEVTSLLLDHLSFSGTPEYSVDFSQERIEHFGFGDSGLHTEISQFSYLNGLWELDQEYLSGSCSTDAEIYTGLYHARDYTVACTIRPQLGWYHLVNFRVQGAARSYAFGFFGCDTVALLKKQITYEVLDTAAFPYELDHEYRISITVKGSSFTLSIDGNPIMSYEDREQCYAYGQVGMTVLHGSHCHYKDLSLEKPGI
jgi:ADP-ribosylglycohydrolase